MTKSTPFPPFSRWLASRSESFLTEVLHHRPDVVSPPPRSSEVLAARLQLRASVLRVLPQLGVLPLTCVEVAVDLGAEVEPVSTDAVIARLKELLSDASVPSREQPTGAHVRAALDQLRARCLIYGDGPGPHGAFSGRSSRKSHPEWEDSFRVLDEVQSAFPPGWQLLPRPNQASVDELRAAIAEVDSKQQRLLNTLVHSGGLGSTRDAALDADPTLPVPRLIASHLLERIDESTVRLPARVRALLRGIELPEIQRSLRPLEPAVIWQKRADDRAAAEAWEAVRRVTELVEFLGSSPIATLKDNTIGVRETRHLCEALSLDESDLAETVALAHASGLVRVGTPHPLPEVDSGGDYLAPTLAADEFLHQGIVARWATLACALVYSDQAPWLVGDTADDGKRIALLSPRAHLSGLPSLRPTLLQCCHRVATAPSREDTTVHNSGGAAALISDFRSYFTHYFPITSTRTSNLVLDGITRTATQLGLLVASGSAAAGNLALGITSAGRAVVDHVIDGSTSAADLHRAFADLLPPPAVEIMAQADNTIIVPGPASPELDSMLKSIAVLESPGLASVFRITEDSLGRALDSGLSAAEIRAFLDEHVLGDVPQSITYLLDDVARRHGRLRGGPAASFIRCDDKALVASLMSASVAENLGFRRIADTVIVSQAPLARVIEETRAAGYSIVAEDALGIALDLNPDPCRIHAAAPDPTRPAGVDEERISAALVAIAAGDRAEASDTSTTIDITDDRSTGTAAYSLLQHACRSGRDVVISFVDRNGKAGRRKVRPVTVSAGQVDAIDPGSGQVLRFLLHRITEVALDG